MSTGMTSYAGVFPILCCLWKQIPACPQVLERTEGAVVTVGTFSGIINNKPLDTMQQHTNHNNLQFNPQSNKLWWLLVIYLISFTKQYGFPMAIQGKT